MNSSLHALNRFGLGARPGEAARIGDPHGWLRAQLDGPPPALTASETPSSIAASLRTFRAAAQGTPDQRQAARRAMVAVATGEAEAALSERITTDRPFVERLVAFWSNHLCISTMGKQAVAPLAGLYEREAIRPHVLGRFEEMVLASARHPAMLIYLDNAQSIGPDSPAARRAPQRGLNENYARELLELHTLGVDGGYTQQDVQELARILTGWTVGGLPGVGPGRAALGGAFNDPDGPIGFAFVPQLHQPGAKTVLGVRYPEAGVEEGERVIRDLCRHPSTATFIARKLATHFISDGPPAAAVERLAGIFRDTGGDLREVSRALVDLPEAWDPANRKLRTPQDWLVAVMRTSPLGQSRGAGGAPPMSPVRAGQRAGAAADSIRAARAGGARNPGAAAGGRAAPVAALLPMLRQLRHPLWAPLSPKGFTDLTADWADPDSLLNRAELGRTLATRIGGAIDPGAVLETIDLGPDDPLYRMLADTSIPAPERVALAIAGPAFHWR